MHTQTMYHQYQIIRVQYEKATGTVALSALHVEYPYGGPHWLPFACFYCQRTLVHVGNVTDARIYMDCV